MKLQKWATALFCLVVMITSERAYSMSVPGSTGTTSANTKIEKIELSIAGTDGFNCSGNAFLDIHIITSKPGTAGYYIFQKGGAISGPFIAKLNVTTNGKYAARIKRPLNSSNPQSAEFMVTGAGIDAAIRSKWVAYQPYC